MAAREGFGGRDFGRVIAWLSVPRAVTFPALLAIGLGLGEITWQVLDSAKLLAWASGMAAPFCMICATSVWAMRDRMTDVIDTEQMSSVEYARFVKLESTQRLRSTLWAGATALLALCAATPAISHQLADAVWHWSVLLAGSAVTCSVYPYQLASHWDNQIRAFKSSQKLAVMRRREQQDLLDRIGGEAASSKAPGWVQGPPLTTISKHH